MLSYIVRNGLSSVFGFLFVVKLVSYTEMSLSWGRVLNFCMKSIFYVWWWPYALEVRYCWGWLSRLSMTCWRGMLIVFLFWFCVKSKAGACRKFGDLALELIWFFFAFLILFLISITPSCTVYSNISPRVNHTSWPFKLWMVSTT